MMHTAQNIKKNNTYSSSCHSCEYFHPQNIKKNNAYSKLFWLGIISIFIMTSVNAELLVNTSIDKNSITINEISFFNVTLFNNDKDILDYPIRIETSNNLILVDSDNQIFFNIIEELKEDRTKEIKFRFKAINDKEDKGTIFLYYGSNYQYASGTFVNIEKSLITTKTNAEKKIVNGEEKIFLNININNESKKPIYNIGVEAIVPNNFVIKTDPLFIPILEDKNKINYEIEILPPLQTNGTQKFVLTYGFFDENKPHYFEETFNFSFEKKNNLLLAGIGIIILIIAVFFFITNNNKEPEVKGTE